MRRKIYAGTVGFLESIFVRDTSQNSAVTGLAGLSTSTSGLKFGYRRSTDTSWTEVTLTPGSSLGNWLSANSTHAGFIEEDSVNAPGQYQISIPDAAIASGVDFVAFRMRGAVNMEEIAWTYELDAVNYQDGNAFGLAGPIPSVTTVTNLTNAPANGDLTVTMKASIATQISNASLATASGLASALSVLQSHGDSAWATATGFALAGSAPSWYTAPDNSDIASLVTSVGASLGSHVSSIQTLVSSSGVVVATNNDKTGYALAASGLDSIDDTEPSGSVDGWDFRQRLLALFGRFFNKATAPDSGNGTLTLYQRDSTTTMSTQAISDDGSTQTQGGA